MEGVRLEATDGGTRLRIRVQPRASRAALLGEHAGALKVAITAPPVEGEANAALVKLLATRLGVPRRAVRIVSGERSRNKTVQVEGLTPGQVRAALR